MNVLVTGGTGRLGRVLTFILKENKYAVISADSSNFDLKEDNLKEKLNSINPDFIIHTAALSNVDRCEENPDLALKINSDGTEKIARYAGKYDVPVLYISTDYIFDGKNPPYSEEDTPNPLSVYGRTKLRGEEFIKPLPRSVVLRVSWLFGPEKTDFIDFVLDSKMYLPVVSKQISKPTCTIDISHAILNLMENRASGIFHFANPPSTSRLKWAREIIKLSGKKIKIKETTWEKLGLPAERPVNSTLSTEKYEKSFGSIRDWKTILKKDLQDKW